MKNNSLYKTILPFILSAFLLGLFKGAYSQSVEMKRQTTGTCGTIYTTNDLPWVLRQSIGQSGIAGTSYHQGRYLIQGYIQPEIIRVGKNKETPLQVRVYPNPLQDELHITFEMKPEDAGFIEVFSLMGKPVLHTRFPPLKDITIRFPNVPAGIYVLRIRLGDQIFTDELIKL